MKFVKNGLEFKKFDNSEEDISFIEDLYSDKEVKKYLFCLKRKMKISNTIYNTPFIIRDIYTDNVVGYVFFYEPNLKEVELMYATHQNYRREGYGKRILEGASTFILDKEKSIENIVLIINPNNIASINTASKSGFERVGNIRYKRKR